MTVKPFEMTEILGAEGKATEAFRRVHERIQRGFHEDTGSHELQDWVAREHQRAGLVYRGFEETDPVPEWAGTAPRPVATIIGFPRLANVGNRTVDTWAVSGVGVASSHRRRGLLRTMMTDELVTAQRNGYALSALTASEGGIYGRFGYGVATRYSDYVLDLRYRPKVLETVLEATGAGCGQVVEADPRNLLPLAEELATAVTESQPGQVSRLRLCAQNNLGIVDLEHDSTDPVRKREAFVFLGASGPEGFVILEHQGYESDPPRAKVVDFQASTPAAWAGLWNHLFTVDLLEVVDFKEAPGNPLSSVLQNPRAVTLKNEADLIWARILDVVTVLESRTYGRDGQLVLLVDDSMGLITGSYALDVVDGKATVTPSDLLEAPGERGDHAADDPTLLPHAPRVRFPADRLATAVFRGCDVESRYGVVRGEGAEQAVRVFAVEREAYCDFAF